MSESSVAQRDRLARERTGIALYRERGEEIEHIKGRTWAVPSCSGLVRRCLWGRLMAALFTLGRVVATSGALEALEETDTDALALIRRHAAGDWGEVPPEDARENRLSVREGFRVLSSYPVGDGEAGERVWIITEADRSSTCLLLPSEY